jgi:hypothetical protein
MCKTRTGNKADRRRKEPVMRQGEYDDDGKTVIVTLESRGGKWRVTQCDEEGWEVICPFESLSKQEAVCYFESLVSTEVAIHD